MTATRRTGAAKISTTKSRSKPALSLKTSAAVGMLWCAGRERSEIAAILGITPWSVKYHLQSMGYLPAFTKGRVPLGKIKRPPLKHPLPEELAKLHLPAPRTKLRRDGLDDEAPGK